MAGYIPTGLAGGFTYTPTSYTYGQTSQAIGGGFSFNLPLDTIAAFTNAGLNYAQTNSQNAQGFLSGVIGQAQGNLSSAISQSATYGSQAYNQGLQVQQYGLKQFYNPSFCFITTAVTAATGKPDNCWELQLLRKFRDEFVAALPEGVALIKQYYALAPQIVAALETKDDKSSIYARLASLFIYPALQAISRGDNNEAMNIYTGMVEFARVLSGVPLPAPVEAVVDVVAQAPAAPVVPDPTTAAPVTLESLAALVAQLVQSSTPAVSVVTAATPVEQTVATLAPIVEAAAPAAAPVVQAVEQAIPVAGEVAAAVSAPTASNINAVVEGLGTLATAVIPGAAPVVAVVEAAEHLEPVAAPLFSAAADWVEGLFHHTPPVEPK